MATFQVPQFIDEKPKIFGPLSVSQFLYLVLGAAISYACYRIFTLYLWLFITVVLAAICGSLAFLKINGFPLPSIILHALRHWIQPHAYTWQRTLPHTAISTSSLERIERMRTIMQFQENLKSFVLRATTATTSSLKTPDAQKTPEERYQMVKFITGEKKLAKRVDYK